MLVLGGDAVVTRLDLQAAGGLYDEIMFQIFPQRPGRTLFMQWQRDPAWIASGANGPLR